MGMISIIDRIPDFQDIRQDYGRLAYTQKQVSRAFEASVASMDGNYSIFDGMNCGAKLPEKIPNKDNLLWANAPFGAVGTVGDVGSSGALQSAVILDYLDSIASPTARDRIKLRYSVQEIMDSYVQKGYRLWKLERKKGVMSAPVVTLQGIKERLPRTMSIQSLRSLDAVFEMFGVPIEMGTSPLWLDWLIHLLAGGKISLISQTRIKTVGKLVQNLVKGIPVPMVWPKSVVNTEGQPIGGRNVTLYRIENNRAIIIDTSCSENGGGLILPISITFNQMVRQHNKVVVWDLEPAVNALTTM